MLIYSVSLGGVDSVFDPPDTGHRSIMFTDRPTKWPEYHIVNTGAPRKTVREIKTTPPLYGEDIVIYADANVDWSTVDIKAIDKFIKSDKSIGLVPHQHFATLSDELRAMSHISDPTRKRYDIPKIADSVAGHEHLRLYQGGFVAFKNTYTARRFAAEWNRLIDEQGHYRDQVALAKTAAMFMDSIYELAQFSTFPHRYIKEDMDDKYKKLGNDYHWRDIERGEYSHVDRILKAIKYMPKTGNTVVDFGCGDGVATSLMAKEYDDVIGVEILDGPREVTKQKVPNASVFGKWEPSGKYDLFLIDVLEHVDDEHIDNVSSLIRNADNLVISFPHNGMDDYAVRDISIEWLRNIRDDIELLHIDGTCVICGALT